MLEALQRLGLRIYSLSDLNLLDAQSGPLALPILLGSLPRLQHANHRAAVVQAITEPWARPEAAKTLIDEFISVRSEGNLVRWTIGNALSEVADDSVIDPLETIILDQSYGRDREMVALAFARMRDKAHAVSVLIRAASDEAILGHVLWALRLIADQRARDVFARHVDHPIPWIRKEARRGLEKLGKQGDPREGS
jgi:HEAT repeat protein